MPPLLEKGVGERGEHDHRARQQTPRSQTGTIGRDCGGRFPGVGGEVAGMRSWGCWRTPSPRKYRGDRHTPSKSLCTRVCACVWSAVPGGMCRWAQTPVFFLSTGSVHKIETPSRAHTHTHTHARRGIRNSKHPAPCSEQPPTPRKASPTEPHRTLSRAKVVANSCLPPSPESHGRRRGRAAGGRSPGPPHTPPPGRAHRPPGQSCEQPRRCQPARSGSRARRGERTIVAAAALGGGAAAEAARPPRPRTVPAAPGGGGG